MQQREYRGVGSNAERQNQDRGERESRAAAKSAQRVADILCKIGEPSQGACVANLLFRECDGPEVLASAVTGIFRGHAGRDIFFHGLLEMKAELLVEILLPAHDSPSMIRSITPRRRFQPSDSFSSACLPAL